MQDLPPQPVAHSAHIIYGLEDRVPPLTALLVGVQHVSAMVVGTITPPLLLSASLGFRPEDTAYFISIALLSSALGAFLQCRRRGPLGSGLLSVTGTSFAFMQPLAQAWQAGGFGLMLGLSCIAAPVQILLSPFIARLRSVFTPLVSGVVVLLIGTTLIPTAFFSLAVPLRPGAPAWMNPLAGLVVIAVTVVAQATGRAWARIGAVAMGIVSGCIIVGLLGGLRAAPSGGGEWITVPRLLPHGFAFSPALLLPFAFIYLVSALEAIGDMTATSQLSGLPAKGDDHWRRITGGVMADGITSTISALFGGFPSATFAQNNGVIQLTGVASRRIGYAMSGILAILGLVPAVGRWVTVIPPPVLGALALMLFGLVAVSGLRLIQSSGPLTQREGTIVALSLGVGLGLPTQPALLADLPVLHTILESGIVAGGLTALLLTFLWPAPKTADSASVDI
jgi:xanthine permease XanP